MRMPENVVEPPLKGTMSRSVTQAYKLDKHQAIIFQVYAIAMEIRHNPFNPGELCTLKYFKLFTRTV